MIGQKHGNMTIVAELPTRYSRRFVMCKCDCGTSKPARLEDLLRGATVSCGCWKTLPRKRKEQA